MATSVRNDNILKHFGGITKNNFKAILDATDDIDNAINFIAESPYIDPANIPKFINKSMKMKNRVTTYFPLLPD